MIHVYPVKDLKEHSFENTICPCNPSIKIENGIITVFHKSFDGREIDEELSDLLWKFKIIKEKGKGAEESVGLTAKQKAEAINFYQMRIEFLNELFEEFKKDGNTDCLITVNFFNKEIKNAKEELNKLNRKE